MRRLEQEVCLGFFEVMQDASVGVLQHKTKLSIFIALMDTLLCVKMSLLSNDKGLPLRLNI